LSLAAATDVQQTGGEIDERFVWGRDDVEWSREPGPPLLTPEEAARAKANLQKWRAEQAG
jgi:hypothetical protein